MVSGLLVRHEPASAAFVRRRLASDLASYDLSPESIDDAVLVVSELLGNAVRHTRASAAGTLDVCWNVDASGVRVSVGDPSDAQPLARIARQDENSGRGLTIVAAMSDEWGVECDGHGKRVWAHVPAQRLHPSASN